MYAVWNWVKTIGFVEQDRIDRVFACCRRAAFGPVHGSRSTGESAQWKKLAWMSRRGGDFVGSKGGVNGFGRDALGGLAAVLGPCWERSSALGKAVNEGVRVHDFGRRPLLLES